LILFLFRVFLHDIAFLLVVTGLRPPQVCPHLTSPFPPSFFLKSTVPKAVELSGVPAFFPYPCPPDSFFLCPPTRRPRKTFSTFVWRPPIPSIPPPPLFHPVPLFRSPCTRGFCFFNTVNSFFFSPSYRTLIFFRPWFPSPHLHGLTTPFSAPLDCTCPSTFSASFTRCVLCQFFFPLQTFRWFLNSSFGWNPDPISTCTFRKTPNFPSMFGHPFSGILFFPFRCFFQTPEVNWTCPSLLFFSLFPQTGGLTPALITLP